jgi:hypothetical protein
LKFTKTNYWPKIRINNNAIANDEAENQYRRDILDIN